MIKQCAGCNNSITFKEAYTTNMTDMYRYKYPKCGTKHKATISSILLYALISFAPVIYLVIIHKLGLLLLWWIISVFVMQPLVFKYKKA